MDFDELTITKVLTTTIILMTTYWLLCTGIRLFILRKRSLLLDQIAGTSQVKRHWFFGDLKEYNLGSEGGLDKLIGRPSLFPKMHNFRFNSFFSALHLYHPESVTPLLKSNYTYTSKDTLGLNFARVWIGNGLVTSAGEQWARHRKMITPAFHFKLLRSYASTFNTSAKILVKKWKQSVNVATEVQKPLSLMAMESLLKCAMSIDADCQNTESTDNSAAKYIQAVCDIEEVIVRRLRNIFYHNDWIFRWSALARKLKAALKIADEYADNVIQVRKKERGLREDPSDRESKDFLDVLFNARDENGKWLEYHEIKDEVATFLFAGHDTTTSAISWCLYNLARHPHLQEKCQAEVQSIMGDGEQVEWDDINKFEYLTMFVKESMRLFPSVYGIARMIKKDVGVIPKDSTAVISIITQHRNKHVWANPDKFDPERFSKENRQNIPPLAYIPFSAGPRNCIGQQFAMHEIKITLAHILQSFSVYRDEETPEPVRTMQVILQSKNGIYVKLKPVKGS